MITNKNNLQCLCVWWFVRSFISNSQSIFFISTSRLLQRIQWPNWSEIYWKKNYRLSFGFVVNQPTPPPLPSFFVAVNESLLGDNCILWCYFPRNLWLAFNISTWQLCLSFILHKYFSGENCPRWSLEIQTSILALE